MILKQYYLGCLAHASYLIGDTKSGICAIIDPQRDIDQYLDDAHHFGLDIRHVFLTHFHADFVAGHVELRDRVGATIHLGARGEAEYAFVPMKDHDRVELGSVTLEVLETPGHSPESICILVFDLENDYEKPHAIFTGDTVFVGDVGRPDLRASVGWTADRLGRMLYHSIHEKLLNLPDEILIYPAHGAGSLCGKAISKETVSTLRVQRRYNYALQPMTENEFTAMVTADQLEAPDYFTYDAILNTKERPALDTTIARTLRGLRLEHILQMQAAGAQVLDVRESADFEAAHLRGSFNIGLDGQYASWAGTLLSRENPIVIVASLEREKEAALRLGRIGFDHVAGYLEGGMEALRNRPELLGKTERITAPTLAEWRNSLRAHSVIDVRREVEWKSKRIPQSLNVPLHELYKHLDELPRQEPVVVCCASGYRSAIAASLLERHGLRNAVDLVGGFAAWEAARLPTES